MPEPTFEELAMPLFDALYNYARWLAREPTEAEDLVQETFLKGCRGFDSFAPGTNFKAWMFRILRNTFLSSRSGLRTARSVSIDDELDEAMQIADVNPTPEALLMQRAGLRRMQEGIERLPRQLRDV